MTQCPEGFTQQMLPIEMDCDVFYCVKKHNVGKYQHPKIIRPPYSLPEIAANKYSETNIRIVFDGIEVFSTPISNFNGPIKNDDKFKGGGLTIHSISYFVNQVEGKIEKASHNLRHQQMKLL